MREADVVITMTTARDPVLQGAWLKPGAHVNAAGVNWASRREVDDETVERSASSPLTIWIRRASKQAI